MSLLELGLQFVPLLDLKTLIRTGALLLRASLVSLDFNFVVSQREAGRWNGASISCRRC